MKSPALFSVLAFLLFALAPSALLAKSDTEIKNFLKQTTLAELKGEQISVSDALDAVRQLAGFKQKKIALSVAVPQKADQTRITLDLKGTSAYDAIKTICSLSGLEFTIKRDQVLIY